MRPWFTTLALAAALGLAAGAAQAQDFDGSRPLLLALFGVQECTPLEGCQALDVETAGLPRFLRIDFDQKTIRRAGGPGEGRTTTIERVERVAGLLHVQGAEEGGEHLEDGFGWSLAIDQESGRAVLTAAGKETGFVAFGACLPQ